MKVLITNYTFDASAKTIGFDDYVSISLESILLITNVTDNIIIYNFAGVGKGGTVATNVLTLDYNTTSMSDADNLQIFYDDPTLGFVVSGTVTANLGTINGAATAAKQDIGNGTLANIETLLSAPLAVTGTFWQATQPVSLASVPLPTGAATETTLAALNAKIPANLTVTSTRLLVDGSGVTQPISAAALPLPSGASTASKQDTGNVSLASIDGKIPALGQALGTASVPVVLTAAQLSTLTPPAAITGFATSANQTTIIGHVDGLEGLLTTIDADTGSILTAVQSIDTAVNGTLDVNIVSGGGGGGLTDTELRATPVAVSLSEPISVDDNGGSLTVDGTFWQATQPVSAAALPLPSGAATSALQTQPGVDIGDVTVNNASGAAAVNIQDGGNSITVDGTVTVNAGTDLDTSALALENGGNLQSIAACIKIEDVGHTTGEAGVFVLGVRNDTQTARTSQNTDYSPISVDQYGCVQISDGGNSITVDGTVAIGAGSAVIGHVITDSGSTTAVTGTVAVTKSGTWDITNAGTFLVQAAQSGTWNIGSITTLPSLVAGTALIGKVGLDQTTPGTTNAVSIAQIGSATVLAGNGATGTGSQRVTIASDNSDIPVKNQLQTAGGWTTYHLVSAATTNATVVKASAGQLGAWYIYNSNASARKIAFHNTASAPTAGASIFFSMVIPGLSAANVSLPNVGIAFSTGIAFTTVTGLADNDTAAVALNDLTINLYYN